MDVNDKYNAFFVYIVSNKPNLIKNSSIEIRPKGVLNYDGFP